MAYVAAGLWMFTKSHFPPGLLMQPANSPLDAR